MILLSKYRPGKGLIVGLLIIFFVEAWLHSDHFLHQFRSVFGAGRAMDKVLFVESNSPDLLIVGNSRADNGFDPKTLQQNLGFTLPAGAFNMGIPGADTRILAGILKRLDKAGCFNQNGIRYLVLSLDEALIQDVDTLGQEVFFADPTQMLAGGQYHDLLRSMFRLYGYSQNFRQLREPGTLSRFISAIDEEIEPIGGGAATHLGYRAGFGGLQDSAAAQRQEASAIDPPDQGNVGHLWAMLDLLQTRGVQVAVVFPPLLNRDVLYLDTMKLESAPYRAIADELLRKNIPLIALDAGQSKNPSEFINAGHLNDLGAQRYSKLLGQALGRIWSVAGERRPDQIEPVKDVNS